MLLLLGLSHCSVTSSGPAWACKPVGLAGAVRAGVALCSDDATPAPVAFLARNWKVWAVALVRFVTV